VTLETYAYPVIGDLPVSAIDTPLVLKVLQPIWNEKPETAGRVRGRIESVLGWATTSGYRQGNNPARWRGHLENLLPAKAKVRTVKHHRALAYVEMLEFLAKVRQLREEHPGDVTAAALTFVILTGARTSEVLKVEWEEFAEPGIWRVPAERMKAHQEWRCALSDAAQAVLDDMRKLRTGRYVFPGEHLGDSHRSPDVMMRLLNKLGYGDRMMTHGLRSSLTDWCAEQTNFPAEVRAQALAHKVADQVEAAYRRGDMLKKRVALANAWARYLTKPVPAIGDNVTPIGPAAAQVVTWRCIIR
jgi:integrase